VLAVGGAAAIWVYFQVSTARGPFVWDEGGYVLRSLLTVQSVQRHDLSGVWSATTMDPSYPPLSAAAVALEFLVLGASEAHALGWTAVCFAICALLMWLIGRPLGGIAAGAVAVLFLLGSRMHLEYTATAMLEVPGTALTLLAIWLYLRHRRRPRAGSAWLAGLALAALFLQKYNFGLLLFAAVLANEVLRRPLRPLAADRLGVWLPIVALGGAWLAVPGRLAGFLDFAGNRDSGMSVLASVLFYPREIASYYTAWPPSGLLTIGGAIAALSLRRREDVRFLLWFAGLGLLAMTFHRYKLDRSIATVVPALWLLSAASCADLLRRARGWGAKARWSVAAALVITLLAPLPRLYARDLPGIAAIMDQHRPHPWSRFPWPGRELRAVQDLMTDSVDPRLPIYVAGEFNELSPPVVWWMYAMRHPGAIVMTRCWMPSTPWQAPLNLVTIELFPGSRYFGDDYKARNAQALDWIHPIEESGTRPLVSRVFPESGIRVRVYLVDSLSTIAQ
jgi:ABC-type thiamin/hydroxymethylpyrimidine transport system permease subunit